MPEMLQRNDDHSEAPSLCVPSQETAALLEEMTGRMPDELRDLWRSEFPRAPEWFRAVMYQAASLKDAPRYLRIVSPWGPQDLETPAVKHDAGKHAAYTARLLEQIKSLPEGGELVDILTAANAVIVASPGRFSILLQKPEGVQAFEIPELSALTGEAAASVTIQ
jgi:hypothetical protein